MAMYVKLYYGFYESHHGIRYKTQRLFGLTARLRELGYRVDTFKTRSMDQCLLEMCGREVFRCRIQNLLFNTDWRRDPVCQRALNAVSEATVRMQHADDYFWLRSVVQDMVAELVETATADETALVVCPSKEDLSMSNVFFKADGSQGYKCEEDVEILEEDWEETDLMRTIRREIDAYPILRDLNIESDKYHLESRLATCSEEDDLLRVQFSQRHGDPSSSTAMETAHRDKIVDQVPHDVRCLCSLCARLRPAASCLADEDSRADGTYPYFKTPLRFKNLPSGTTPV